MSHTGTVIHPNRSPGLIRVITTGHIVRSNPNSHNLEFIFCKPESRAEERFVVFLPKSGGVTFDFKTPVTFNLLDYNKFIEKMDGNDRIEFEKHINNVIIPKIPGNPGNFNFKYISTDIRQLEDKFILNYLYPLGGANDPTSIDEFLDTNLDEEFSPTKRVQKENGPRTIGISSILVLDQNAFNDRRSGPEDPWDDFEGVGAPHHHKMERGNTPLYREP
jgi:hypothetical protein